MNTPEKSTGIMERPRANKALVPTTGAPLSSVLSVTRTRHPFSTLTPAPAVGTAYSFAQIRELLAMTMKAVPDYALRAASLSDVPFLIALRETTMGFIIRRHQPWIPNEQMARVLYRFDCASIITRSGHDIGLWKVATDSTASDLIQVQLLPDVQRQGIGRHLIRSLQNECHSAGRHITLHVFASNPALTLYQRLGFRVWEQDEHSLQMIWVPASVST